MPVPPFPSRRRSRATGSSLSPQDSGSWPEQNPSSKQVQVRGIWSKGTLLRTPRPEMSDQQPPGLGQVGWIHDGPEPPLPPLPSSPALPLPPHRPLSVLRPSLVSSEPCPPASLPNDPGSSQEAPSCPPVSALPYPTGALLARATWLPLGPMMVVTPTPGPSSAVLYKSRTRRGRSYRTWEAGTRHVVSPLLAGKLAGFASGAQSCIYARSPPLPSPSGQVACRAPRGWPFCVNHPHLPCPQLNLEMSSLEL